MVRPVFCVLLYQLAIQCFLIMMPCQRDRWRLGLRRMVLQNTCMIANTNVSHYTGYVVALWFSNFIGLDHSFPSGIGATNGLYVGVRILST